MTNPDNTSISVLYILPTGMSPSQAVIHHDIRGQPGKPVFFIRAGQVIGTLDQGMVDNPQEWNWLVRGPGQRMRRVTAGENSVMRRAVNPFNFVLSVPMNCICGDVARLHLEPENVTLIPVGCDEKWPN